MTEREKRIEEMANTIMPCELKSCVDCLVIGVCNDYKECEKLYDAGYRKVGNLLKSYEQH